jgi:hypothetical protein
MRHVVLAKTASRRVLGVMNEFSYLADNYRWQHDVIQLEALSLWLAEVPCSPLFGSEGTPDREFKSLFVGSARDV